MSCSSTRAPGFRSPSPPTPTTRPWPAPWSVRWAKGVRIITTNLVVAETQVLLLRRTGRSAAMTFLAEVRSGPIVVVDSDAELERAAVTEWLSVYSDQAFSLCDAVGFAVMRERGISDALALDHHFDVAGFNRIP